MYIMFINKNLNIGTYLFHRYITFNNKKKLINTYKIEKNKNEYKLIDDHRDIYDVIDHIEIKNKNTALIWAKNSGLGLLYSIVLLKN